jgi:hypothetical protein
VLSHENRLKNALFTTNNVILRLFFAQDQNFSKIHKTDKKFFLAKTKKYMSYDIEWWTKLPSFKDFDEPSSNFVRFFREWPSNVAESIRFLTGFIYTFFDFLINFWVFWRFFESFSGFYEGFMWVFWEFLESFRRF